MGRLVYLTLAGAVAIGISAAGAQTSGDAGSKVQSMTGVVKAVSASSLTVDRGGHEVVFGVDSSIRVLASGRTAGPRDLVLRAPGPGLTDFVKTGDQVQVKYRQSGRALKAVEVRVAPN
jgi:hypothetical protein